MFSLGPNLLNDVSILVFKILSDTISKLLVDFTDDEGVCLCLRDKLFEVHLLLSILPEVNLNDRSMISDGGSNPPRLLVLKNRTHFVELVRDLRSHSLDQLNTILILCHELRHLRVHLRVLFDREHRLVKAGE